MTRIGFESDYPPAVSQVGPREWELTAQMRYFDGMREFVVPAGQRTDYASVPKVLQWLVDPFTGTAAAILHDWLWREEAPGGRVTYRQADRVLRHALRTLRVPLPRRWLMWAAVRWGALTRPGGGHGWWRDAPAVLAVSALALPLVAVPVVATAPFAAVYWVLEWPFRVAARGRSR